MITQLLIVSNVLIFILQFAAMHRGFSLVEEFGLVPRRIAFAMGHPSVPGASLVLLTPFTSMFLHGSFLHLASNMWFLHVFGDNVEDTLGRFRYLVFYVLCGLCAAATQSLVDIQSAIPMIGASGAISGVLAAYLLLYPKARVLTVVPIFIFLQFVELPAYVFIFVWALIQGLMAWLSSSADNGGGVAWFAHIGGFVGGALLLWVTTSRSRPRR
ncbi:MAG: rhomboid family intramembrane serine protease [Polyangiales bacterium]